MKKSLRIFFFFQLISFVVFSNNGIKGSNLINKKNCVNAATDNLNYIQAIEQRFKKVGNSKEIDKERIIKKYAELLKADENEINKYAGLYVFVDSWLGVAYKWGGCDKRGIDCSCFVMTLFNEVFDIAIKRTTFTQFYDNDIALFKNKTQFALGDLLFFKTNINRSTRNNKITHVGFYLANGYFIQSSSNGVNIANLKTTYWKNCFVAAGRLQEKYYKKSGLLMPTDEVDRIKAFAAENVQNQDFEPVPYPGDLDQIKRKYAGMLQVDTNRVQVPEMFAFIEKNKYAPYVVVKNCAAGATSSSCFVSEFYHEVLGLDFDASQAAIISQKNTTQLGTRDTVSAFDIVLIKSDAKAKVYDITGIYLYNSFFLQLDGNNLVINNLNSEPYNHASLTYYRLDNELLKQAFEFIKEKRRQKYLKPAE